MNEETLNSPGRNGDMMSHNDWKLIFPETPLDILRGFLFDFRKIWEVLHLRLSM